MLTTELWFRCRSSEEAPGLVHIAASIISILHTNKMERKVFLFNFIASSLKVARSFRPDFVLIRQPPRDGSRDYRSTLLGLKFGGVPSINSLNSVYQFQVNAKLTFHRTFLVVLI